MSQASQPPPQPPQVAKKKTSVLTIVLVFVGSAFVLGLLGIALIAFLVWRNPEGRRFVGLMGETVEIMRKAQKAPGTKELRALGCGQAMVLEMDDFLRIARQLDAGGGPRPTFGSLVMCAARPWGTAPPCDDVAKTYLSGAGPQDRSFVVSVTQSGKSKPVCQALYDGAGSRLRDFDEDVSVAPPPPVQPDEQP
jgi:hypothetical protein